MMGRHGGRPSRLSRMDDLLMGQISETPAVLFLVAAFSKAADGT